mgnify:FL=1
MPIINLALPGSTGLLRCPADLQKLGQENCRRQAGVLAPIRTGYPGLTGEGFWSRSTYADHDRNNDPDHGAGSRTILF